MVSAPEISTTTRVYTRFRARVHAGVSSLVQMWPTTMMHAASIVAPHGVLFRTPRPRGRAPPSPMRALVCRELGTRRPPRWRRVGGRGPLALPRGRPAEGRAREARVRGAQLRDLPGARRLPGAACAPRPRRGVLRCRRRIGREARAAGFALGAARASRRRRRHGGGGGGPRRARAPSAADGAVLFPAPRALSRRRRRVPRPPAPRTSPCASARSPQRARPRPRRRGGVALAAVQIAKARGAPRGAARRRRWRAMRRR